VSGLKVDLRDVVSEEEAVDRVAGALYELEAGGFEHAFSDGILSVWIAPPEDGSDLDGAAVDAALRAAGFDDPVIGRHDYGPIDWTTHWRHHFHPLRVGDLWVGPSWHTPPEDARAVLRLDPGMAFGTGLHPTTRLCLGRVVEAGPVERILDVGVGSGILALSSLLVGTREAVGVDTDPQALRVAEENARANGLVLRVAGPPADAFGTFPLVVANILAEPLIELAPTLTRTPTLDGTLLLSGLLDRQEAAVRRAYEAQGLRCTATTRDGEWSLLEFRCAD
jgi:ribosomal protein L11 methyltransferase